MICVSGELQSKSQLSSANDSCFWASLCDPRGLDEGEVSIGRERWLFLNSEFEKCVKSKVRARLRHLYVVPKVKTLRLHISALSPKNEMFGGKE